MKFVVASTNVHKLKEIREILGDLSIEIVSMADEGLTFDIEEVGTTFQENALIKARAVAEITDTATLADDSGLEVEALDWRPGIYSARFSGVTGADKDKANREKLLEELIHVPVEKRRARFCSVVACVLPDGREFCGTGYVYGTIGFKEKGENGFGYDSLFLVDDDGRTMAEMSDDEKNAISHRGEALKNLRKNLVDFFSKV